MRIGVLPLAMAVMLAAVPVHASPWGAPSSVALQEEASAAATSAEPTTVEEALEAGDLTTAKALARQVREAEPTAAHWLREAEVLERAGEHTAAAKAYRGARKAAGDDQAAVAAAEEGLARVKARSRGTVPDEPASTHREELDPRWEPPKPKQPEPTPEPEPEPLPPEGDRIVTKWYFWVTVGAIAASAAAVTAIAIKATRDDEPDALDALSLDPAPRGLGTLRF